MNTATDVDIWQLYLANSLQYAADCWPVANFLSILFSQGTERVQVLDRTQPGTGILALRVSGECFDGACSFDYDLTRPDLDRTQKERVLGLIKVCYPAKQDPSRATPKKAAKALGIMYR